MLLFFKSHETYAHLKLYLPMLVFSPQQSDVAVPRVSHLLPLAHLFYLCTLLWLTKRHCTHARA
jgi:hypothetical protein